jgi:hypothetical protein
MPAAMPAAVAGSAVSTARSKPEFPRSIGANETTAAAAIPHADVERSRIFLLAEPLMADLRCAKLAAKTVLDFQLNRYGSCCFTRWLRLDIARL